MLVFVFWRGQTLEDDLHCHNRKREFEQMCMRQENDSCVKVCWHPPNSQVRVFFLFFPSSVDIYPACLHLCRKFNSSSIQLSCKKRHNTAAKAVFNEGCMQWFKLPTHDLCSLMYFSPLIALYQHLVLPSVCQWKAFFLAPSKQG